MKLKATADVGGNRVPLRPLLHQRRTGQTKSNQGNPRLEVRCRQKRRQSTLEQNTRTNRSPRRHRRPKAFFLHLPVPRLRTHGQHHRGRPILQRPRPQGPPGRTPVPHRQLDLGLLPLAPTAPHHSQSKKEADQIHSYARMYEQSGWMPSFSILWGDTPSILQWS